MATTTSPRASLAASATQTCEWEEFIDEDSQTPYYYNARTGESCWSEPDGFVDKPAAGAAVALLPPQWRKFVDDSSGETYYYDSANDVTQWKVPSDFVDSNDSDDGRESPASDDDDDDSNAAPKRETPPTLASASTGSANASEEPEVEATALDASTPDSLSATTATAAVDAPPAQPAATPLTSNWVKHIDRSTGQAYYHDTVSGQTQWQLPPTGCVDASTVVLAPAAAAYEQHVNRVRAEQMARVTRQVLDPTGSLARLNAVLSTVNSSKRVGDAPAPAATAPSTKAAWQQHVDPHTQRFFYHNVATGATQWHEPDAPVVSGLAEWLPPTTSDAPSHHHKTVSGVAYAATATFNRVSGKFTPADATDALATMPHDRAGRQMSHFFDMSALDANRKQAKVVQAKLKRQNIDWKVVAAEKKAKKRKQQTEWLYHE